MIFHYFTPRYPFDSAPPLLFQPKASLFGLIILVQDCDMDIGRWVLRPLRFHVFYNQIIKVHFLNCHILKRTCLDSSAAGEKKKSFSFEEEITENQSDSANKEREKSVNPLALLDIAKKRSSQESTTGSRSSSAECTTKKEAKERMSEIRNI